MFETGRSNRRLRDVSLCVFLTALLSTLLVPAVPVAAEDPAPVGDKGVRQDVCDRTLPGLEDILRPDLFLLLGEVHGTRETPEWFGTMVCAAAGKGYAVRVGLEIPETETKSVEAALEAGDSREAMKILRGTEFFRRDYQDGRSSRSMADLILALRRIRRSGGDLEVFLFDPVRPDDRDRKMADRILAARREEPQAALFVLTGNLHASREKGTPRDADMLPTGYHLVAAGAAPVSLKAVTSGGAAWICQGMEAGDCGPVRIGGRDLGPNPFLSLDEKTAPAGYDGILFLGKVTASPPLQELKGD